MVFLDNKEVVKGDFFIVIICGLLLVLVNGCLLRKFLIIVL